MRLFARIFGDTPAEHLLQEQADLWAAQHYSGAERAVAAMTARIVAEQVSVSLSELSPTTRLIEDLKMYDPLEGVDLVLAIEQGFGIKIPDADAEKINTVGALVAYLHGRVQPRPA